MTAAVHGCSPFPSPGARAPGTLALMPTPSFDDIADIALTTDAAILERVRDLVDGAYRRQLWLMLLDDEHRQLPVVLPCDVPAAPPPVAARGVRRFVGGLSEEFDVGSVIVVLERPGAEPLTAGDRGWLRIAANACRAAGLPLRGPVMATDAGFRWIAAEDFLVSAE